MCFLDTFALMKNYGSHKLEVMLGFYVVLTCYCHIEPLMLNRDDVNLYKWSLVWPGFNPMFMHSEGKEPEHSAVGHPQKQTSRIYSAVGHPNWLGALHGNIHSIGEWRPT